MTGKIKLLLTATTAINLSVFVVSCSNDSRREQFEKYQLVLKQDYNELYRLLNVKPINFTFSKKQESLVLELINLINIFYNSLQNLKENNISVYHKFVNKYGDYLKETKQGLFYWTKRLSVFANESYVSILNPLIQVIDFAVSQSDYSRKLELLVNLNPFTSSNKQEDINKIINSADFNFFEKHKKYFNDNRQINFIVDSSKLISNSDRIDLDHSHSFASFFNEYVQLFNIFVEKLLNKDLNAIIIDFQKIGYSINFKTYITNNSINVKNLINQVSDLSNKSFTKNIKLIVSTAERIAKDIKNIISIF